MCHLPPISTPFDVPSYPTALTRRLRARASTPGRVMVSNRKHTHVYRPKVCPDPIRPAPSTLSIVIQPGAKPVSRPVSQFTSCRPVEPSLQPENHDRGICGQDR